MRCNICDRALAHDEINFNNEIKAFDPCFTCLEIALDAAFSQGYDKPDEDGFSFVVLEQDTDEDVPNNLWNEGYQYGYD